MLYSQVVADNTVDSGAALIELLVGEDDEHSLLSLLASYKDSVATEELEGVHGGLREGDDAVIIVDGVGNPGFGQYTDHCRPRSGRTYINWLGFFFFFRMAVAVSSSCYQVSFPALGI